MRNQDYTGEIFQKNEKSEYVKNGGRPMVAPTGWENEIKRNCSRILRNLRTIPKTKK